MIKDGPWDGLNQYGGWWDGRSDYTSRGMTTDIHGVSRTETGFRPNYNNIDHIQERNNAYYGGGANGWDDREARNLMSSFRRIDLQDRLNRAPERSSERIYLQRELDQGAQVQGRIGIGPGALSEGMRLARMGGFQLDPRTKGMLASGDPKADPHMWSHGIPGGGGLASGTRTLGGAGTFGMSDMIASQRADISSAPTEIHKTYGQQGHAPSRTFSGDFTPLSERPHSNSYMPSNQAKYDTQEAFGSNFRPWAVNEHGENVRTPVVSYYPGNVRPPGALNAMGKSQLADAGADLSGGMAGINPTMRPAPPASTWQTIHKPIAYTGEWAQPEHMESTKGISAGGPAAPLQPGTMYGDAKTWGLDPGELFPGYVLPVGPNDLNANAKPKPTPPQGGLGAGLGGQPISPDTTATAPGKKNVWDNDYKRQVIDSYNNDSHLREMLQDGGKSAFYKNMVNKLSKATGLPPENIQEVFKRSLPLYSQPDFTPYKEVAYDPTQAAPSNYLPEGPSGRDEPDDAYRRFYGPDKNKHTAPSPFSPASLLGRTTEGLKGLGASVKDMFTDDTNDVASQASNQAYQPGKRQIWQGPDDSGDTMTVSTDEPRLRSLMKGPIRFDSGADAIQQAIGVDPNVKLDPGNMANAAEIAAMYGQMAKTSEIMPGYQAAKPVPQPASPQQVAQQMMILLQNPQILQLLQRLVH